MRMHLLSSPVLRGGTASGAAGPNLTGPTYDTVTGSSVYIRVTTNTANGVLYVVLTTSATAPTGSQIINGLDHLGAAATYSTFLNITNTGQKWRNPTGLAGGTYYAHWVHVNSASVSSNIASTTGITITGADVTAPVVNTRTINAAGTSLTLAMSESVTVNNGTGFTVSLSGGAASVTYASGSGTSSLVYTLSRTVNAGETGTLSYSTVANGIEDAAGNDLDNISSASITNNSSAGGGAGASIAGGTINISGSGFGTKTTANPLIYDDFRNGTAGNPVSGEAPVYRAIGGSFVWDDFVSSGNAAPQYSTAQLLGNKIRSCLHSFSGGYDDCAIQFIHPMTASGDEIYMTWWEYYDRLDTDWSRNQKPFYIYGSASDVPTMLCGFGSGNSAGPDYDPQFRTTAQDSPLSPNTVYGSVVTTETPEQWYRWEFYIRQSSPSTADGALQYHLHLPDSGNPVEQIANNAAFCTRGGSGYFRQFMLRQYHDSATTSGGQADANFYTTDVYVDSTRARVELGNASTWSACIRRFIQPATSWSGTAIAADFNQGTFTSGQTAYVYVVDSSGAVVNSSGYAVTIP